MPIKKIDIHELLNLKPGFPVFDVRSPGEFHHAHIPNAFSLPIFDNEERKVIGTAYKQQSREIAIKLGLDFFGKKLVTTVEAAENIVKSNGYHSKEVIVHCWRGGMRSAAMAWLLDLYGFKVYLLIGGYKTYRRWAIEQFQKQYNLHIISGCTGSNKTGLLLELKKQHEPVIDLEGLAKHKGSTFGNLNEHPQPGQEYFENLLAENLFELSGKPQQKIWIEGESQRIGLVNIPKDFYEQMLFSNSTRLEIPFEQRLTHVIEEYGQYESAKIEKGILRITKKLGGLETKNAITFLHQNDLQNCFAIILKYYDKLYRKSAFTKSDTKKSQVLISETIDAQINSQKLLQNEFKGTNI